MKKSTVSIVFIFIGVLLFVGGLVSLKVNMIQIPALPYVCIGIGSGLFGQGMGEILKKRAIKNKPEIAQQIEIEQNDERNIAIGNRAKAKAYDMMIFLYGALLLAFALMNIDWKVELLFVAAYLFVIGYGIYFRCKYDKEM